MLQYPQIDPVAISLGPFAIHWYGLMYVVGFVAAWWLGRRRALRRGVRAPGGPSYRVHRLRLGDQ